MADDLVFRKRTQPFGTMPQMMVFDSSLSQTAKVVFVYLDVRSGNKDYAFPGITKMSIDLGCSEPTVKRALRELRDGNWIRRERRMGRTSLTFIYECPEDCLKDISDQSATVYENGEIVTGDSHSQITGDLTVRSPVIPPNKNQYNKNQSIAEKENSARGRLKENRNMTPEQHEECMAYLSELSEDEINALMEEDTVLAGLMRDGKPWLDEWAYWVGEILPQEKERQNVLSMPVEDLSAVQHFHDEDVIRVVKAFNRLWGVPIPTSSKSDKSRVKDWSNGARQVLSVCDGHDAVQVMEAFKQWRDQVDPEMEIMFPRPSSLVNMLGSFIPKYKPVSTQPTEYDKHGLPILR